MLKKVLVAEDMDSINQAVAIVLKDPGTTPLKETLFCLGPTDRTFYGLSANIIQHHYICVF